MEISCYAIRETGEADLNVFLVTLLPCCCFESIPVSNKRMKLMMIMMIMISIAEIIKRDD